MNRPKEIKYPEDTSSVRKIAKPAYNRSGALEKVDFDGTNFVEHVAYNAKGQRLLIAFGNGVMTRYAYDNQTFRLKRIRSETFDRDLGTWEFESAGSVKQDTAYGYDLAGNIVASHERTTGCGVGGTNALDRSFEYDALYRLLKATGRENAPTITPIWDDGYRSNDSNTTTAYTQNYAYDKMGNILNLQHIGNSNFTRVFNPDTGGDPPEDYGNNNHLNELKVGAATYDFLYDDNGNLKQQNTERFYEWDYVDRMRSFYIDDGSTITKYAHYLYDSGGNRIKKIVRNDGGSYDSITYIDGIYEYRTDGTKEQALSHIMDDKSRIAMVREGDNFGDTKPPTKYILEDHLGSSVMELEDDGSNIEKEEYYPFGETSYASYQLKRYKYNGKERDEESGLYYYGARYYAAWCCRFISVDKKAYEERNVSPYAYVGNNPIINNDPSGNQKEKQESGNSNGSQDTNVSNSKGLEWSDGETGTYGIANDKGDTSFQGDLGSQPLSEDNVNTAVPDNTKIQEPFVGDIELNKEYVENKIAGAELPKMLFSAASLGLDKFQENFFLDKKGIIHPQKGANIMPKGSKVATFNAGNQKYRVSVSDDLTKLNVTVKMGGHAIDFVFLVSDFNKYASETDPVRKEQLFGEFAANVIKTAVGLVNSPTGIMWGVYDYVKETPQFKRMMIQHWQQKMDQYRESDHRKFKVAERAYQELVPSRQQNAFVR